MKTQAYASKLTTDPIGPTLTRLAAPMLVGILGMMAPDPIFHKDRDTLPGPYLFTFIAIPSSEPPLEALARRCRNGSLLACRAWNGRGRPVAHAIDVGEPYFGDTCILILFVEKMTV